MAALAPGLLALLALAPDPATRQKKLDGLEVQRAKWEEDPNHYSREQLGLPELRTSPPPVPAQHKGKAPHTPPAKAWHERRRVPPPTLRLPRGYAISYGRLIKVPRPGEHAHVTYHGREPPTESESEPSAGVVMASSPTTGRAKRAAIVQELQRKGVMALPPAWWGVPPAWIRDTPWWLRRTRFAPRNAKVMKEGGEMVKKGFERILAPAPSRHSASATFVDPIPTFRTV